MLLGISEAVHIPTGIKTVLLRFGVNYDLKWQIFGTFRRGSMIIHSNGEKEPITFSCQTSPPAVCSPILPQLHSVTLLISINSLLNSLYPRPFHPISASCPTRDPAAKSVLYSPSNFSFSRSVTNLIY